MQYFAVRRRRRAEHPAGLRVEPGQRADHIAVFAGEHGIRQYRSGGEKGRTHGLHPHESAGGQFEVLRQPAAVHQARIVAAGESDRVAGTVEPFRVERDCVEIRAVQITGGHLGPRTRIS